MSEIRREVQPDPAVVPALDPTVLSLSDVEKEFLHETITTNDEELRAKLLHVQKVFVMALAVFCPLKMS